MAAFITHWLLKLSNLCHDIIYKQKEYKTEKIFKFWGTVWC